MSRTAAPATSSSSGSQPLAAAAPSPSSVQAAVADHYNRIRVLHPKDRHTSRIVGVKRLNNWVKAVLIRRYARRGAAVLDLCCGKGGDLKKYERYGIGTYVGADHALESVKEAVGRYNAIQSVPFAATFMCADCHSVRLASSLPPSLHFDLVSCQFALHYCFESYDRARMFAANIGERLRPGGFFVATIPNAHVLTQMLEECVEKQKQARSKLPEDSPWRKKPYKLEWGNSVYKVKFTQPCPLVDDPAHQTASSAPSDPSLPPLPSSPFGVQYTFDLVEAIESCPEYLVHLPTLSALLAAYDMELVAATPMHTFLLQHAAHNEYARLLRHMNALGNEEKERPPTQDEWDVVSVYMALVYRRRLPDEPPGSYVDLSLHSAPSAAHLRCEPPPINPDAEEEGAATTQQQQPKQLKHSDIIIMP